MIDVKFALTPLGTEVLKACKAKIPQDQDHYGHGAMSTSNVMDEAESIGRDTSFMQTF